MLSRIFARRRAGSVMTPVVSKDRRKSRHLCHRPKLEALEDRLVPSTINTWRSTSPVPSVWSDATNWSLGHVPTSSEIATFDATSAVICIIDSSAVSTNTVSGINMTFAYLGFIEDTADLTIGADGFVGTFFSVTSSTTIKVVGDWSESAPGGFTGGSGTVDFNSAATQTIHDVNSTFNNLTHSGAGRLNLTGGVGVGGL